MFTYTTQKQIRAAFWQAHPDLPNRRYRYSPNRSDKNAPLVYPIDTRCAFVDFVDFLEKSGDIGPDLAYRATL